MSGSKRVALVDTNIMIEAVRVGCWKGLRGHYDLVTVDKCREEALSGKHWSPGYVTITEANLKKVTVATVSELERAALQLACPDAMGLDDGERELWAHANSRNGDWEVPCAEKAALRVAMGLGWGERVLSLEKLLTDAGLKPSDDLRRHFTTRRLNIWRTEILQEEQ